MGPQLAFWQDSFGDDPVEIGSGEVAPIASDPDPVETDEEDLTGVSFIFALLYLGLLLPLISLLVFFFKRLSVNRLLKRVVVAAGSAIGLALASAAYASAFGG